MTGDRDAELEIALQAEVETRAIVLEPQDVGALVTAYEALEMRERWFVRRRKPVPPDIAKGIVRLQRLLDLAHGLFEPADGGG